MVFNLTAIKHFASQTLSPEYFRMTSFNILVLSPIAITELIITLMGPDAVRIDFKANREYPIVYLNFLKYIFKYININKIIWNCLDPYCIEQVFTVFILFRKLLMLPQ